MKSAAAVVLGLLSEGNLWSVAVVLGCLSPALAFTVLVSGRVPSYAQAGQKAYHCELYNNDGAGSVRGCLVQWCTNEARWPYERCNMTAGFVPFDPLYNANVLSGAFPYDTTNAGMLWISFGLLAGAYCLEAVVAVLQCIDPSKKHEASGSVTKRYSTLLLALATILWIVRLGTAGLLFFCSYQSSMPWGLYNVPSSLLPASAILIAVVLAVHLFHRALGLCRTKYLKRLSGGQQGSTRISGKESSPQGIVRLSSLAKVAHALHEADLPPSSSFIAAETKTSRRSTGDPSNVVEYTWGDLWLATKGFDKCAAIGKGGFGEVFKGSLSTGQVVAIKVLQTDEVTGDSILNYTAELEVISRVHHRNLVRLLGYCSRGERLALVLEFMERGSLSDLLQDGRRESLDWSKRLHVAVGAARGLSYLHNDCTPRVVHRDIKASNILLDQNFNAKVADFGLARILGENNNHTTTRVMGTIGYLAPDYAFSGTLTDKSDVYSFGVVLLELLTGRKPVDPLRSGLQQSLVEWAWMICSSTDDPLKFIDPLLYGNFVEAEATEMWSIAVACVNHMASNRPGMDEVLRRLVALTAKHNSSLLIDSNGELRETSQQVPGSGMACKDDEHRTTGGVSKQSSLESIFRQLLITAGQTFETRDSVHPTGADYDLVGE